MSEVHQSENNNEETLPLSPDCVQKKITSGTIEFCVEGLPDGHFVRIPLGAI